MRPRSAAQALPFGAGAQVTAGAWPEIIFPAGASGRFIFVSVKGPEHQTSGIGALWMLLTCRGFDVLGKVPRYGAHAGVAESELVTEVLPALRFLSCLDQTRLGFGVIGEEEREAREHGPRLEIEILDRLLLVRVEGTHARELLDGFFVTEW